MKKVLLTLLSLTLFLAISFPVSAASSGVDTAILEQNKNVRQVIGDFLYHSTPMMYSALSPVYAAANDVETLKAESDAIVGNAGSQYEKAKALYYWVATNIKYGTYYGSPLQIMYAREGVCEGYSILLCDLLAAQKIPAITINVATNRTGNPWKQESYNVSHTVVLAVLDGRPVWMDPTWDELTSTHLEYFDQSDEAFSKEHFAMQMNTHMGGTYLFGKKLQFINDDLLFGYTGNDYVYDNIDFFYLKDGVLAAEWIKPQYSKEGFFPVLLGLYFLNESSPYETLDGFAFFQQDGTAYTGSHVIEGRQYYFSAHGAVEEGEILLPGGETYTTISLNHEVALKKYENIQFSLPAAGLVTISYSISYADADDDADHTIIQIQDSEFHTVYSSGNNNFGERKNFSTHSMYLDAGQYFLSHGNYRLSEESDIVFTVSFIPDSDLKLRYEHESNGSFYTATPFRLGDICIGYTDHDCDVDVYSFTLNTTETVSINTSHTASIQKSGGWEISLYDSPMLCGGVNSSKARVAYTDLVSGDGAGVNVTLSAGTYYIYIDPVNFGYSKQQPVPDTYQLSVYSTGKTGWQLENGLFYWYEGGVKQGTEGRGKEIYDPDSDAWYWLDAVQGGAMAVSKDVYQESYSAYPDREDGTGKWVRYDENGHMVKGWQTTDAGTYYFETITGAMAKGNVTIDGQNYYFDEITGILSNSVTTDGWNTLNGQKYWYEGGVKQGTEGRGKEIYDPDSDAWYWLDAVQGGAMAVSKDVYQESYSAYPDREDGTGKWVRYDENGHMVKGWQTTDAGTYYFETITGAMAKGNVTIDGQNYYFDEITGILR